jgi:DNA-binding NtrC family response regulator
VELPPLRLRREDIPLLVEFFAARFAQHLDRPIPAVSPEALERLQRYDWPGNVRELEHLMQRAMLLCKDRTIREEDLAVVLHRENPTAPQESGELDLLERLLEKAAHQGNGGPHNLLEAAEELVVRTALARSQGNRRKAAALLGVDRKKVERSLKKYSMPDNGAGPS